MDEILTRRRPVPGWFRLAAIAALLFMALGCATYMLHVTSDPASLPLDRRAAVEAQPMWVTAAYAVAVWVGLLGALMLLLRRRLAEPLLLASVIAVVVWLAGLLLVPELRRAIGADDIGVAAVVALVTGSIWSFARRSRKRGWLR